MPKLEKQKLVIVMGVSGCGKSSVASAMATKLAYEFVEADEFHSQANKARMSKGQALTDAMRDPWVDAIKSHLTVLARTKQNCLLSFSGLRAKHRARMRELPFDIVFVHLVGDKKLILKRMTARTGHFMSSHLLESQYLMLQSTDDEPDIYCVDVNQSIHAVIADALNIVAAVSTSE